MGRACVCVWGGGAWLGWWYVCEQMDWDKLCCTVIGRLYSINSNYLGECTSPLCPVLAEGPHNIALWRICHTPKMESRVLCETYTKQTAYLLVLGDNVPLIKATEMSVCVPVTYK